MANAKKPAAAKKTAAKKPTAKMTYAAVEKKIKSGNLTKEQAHKLIDKYMSSIEYK